MKKKRIYLLTALLLAVSVCVAEPIVSGAEVLNLDKKCSMTIFLEQKEKPEDQKFESDLKKANIVLDIYKVADAKKTPGYDTYTYTFVDPYKRLQSEYDNKLKKSDILKDPNLAAEGASFWRELSQTAGKILLGAEGVGNEQTLNYEPVESVSVKEDFKWKISNLDHGLYMIIARSSDMTSMKDYRIVMEDPRGAEKGVDGDVATIANSELYTYIFSPELISVPMRGKESGILDVTGPITGENGPLPNDNGDGMRYYRTSDDIQWVYDINVYLKPIRVPRYGSLTIEKNLDPYESEEIVDGASDGTEGQDEQVTFVFKAVWPDSDYAKAGSRVDSITFNYNEPKKKRIILERIPVGTTITVTEEYSGASYYLTHEQPEPVMVTADKIQNGRAILDNDGRVKTIIGDIEAKGTEVEADVSFTNSYDKRQKKGYGINNKFTYKGNGDWQWTSDNDSTGKTVHNGTGIPSGGNGENGNGEQQPEPVTPDTPAGPETPNVPETPIETP